jgi:integrase
VLLSEAIRGFFIYAETGVYSPAYIPTMRIQLNYICKYFGDPEIESLTSKHWEQYIHHLHTEYKPVRFGGDNSPLASSTIDNHWKTIRGFYNWASKRLDIVRTDLTMPRPKYLPPEIIPFAQEEVKKIIEASQYTRVIKQSGRTYRIKRPNADRDKAIILIFLDTGVRLGEFTRILYSDLNLESGEIHVRGFNSSIKSMPRTVFIGRRTKEIVWKYLAKLPDEPRDNHQLFDLKPTSIRLMLHRIGANAKVPKTHPHRFRHTFAVNYLLNGGDVFTLQKLLGHKTLEVTMRYVHFLKSDMANIHLHASPVDNWKL